MAEPHETDSWQCQRCLWILGGRGGDEIREHATECPFRDTGKDPQPRDLQVGADET
jgi:rubredoxin